MEGLSEAEAVEQGKGQERDFRFENEEEARETERPEQLKPGKKRWHKNKGKMVHFINNMAKNIFVDFLVHLSNSFFRITF